MPSISVAEAFKEKQHELEDEVSDVDKRVALVEQHLAAVSSSLEKFSEKLDGVHESNTKIEIHLQNLNSFVKTIKKDYIGDIKRDMELVKTDVVGLKIRVAKIGLIAGMFSGVGASGVILLVKYLLGS